MSVENLQRQRDGNAIVGQRTGASYAVENIAALEAVQVALMTDGMVVQVMGYYEAADGGGGLFVYDSTSDLAANGGTIIAPDSGAGRWIRDASGTLFARWFGAIPDGVTDCTESLQSLVDAVNEQGGGRASFEEGTFLIAGKVRLSEYDGVHLVGTGKGSTVIKSAMPVGTPTIGTPTMIDFTGCTNFSVRGITFDNDNILTTALHTMMVGVLQCENFTFTECEFINLKRFGLGINSSVRFWVNKSYFYRSTIENSYQNGSIRLFATVGDCGPAWIEDNEADGAGMGYEGIDITYAFNRISNFGYGAGIVTNASATSLRATIIGNTIMGGTGQDADGVYCTGIESYAAYSRIIGNISRNNDGTGITFGGKYNIVADNQCIDNGSAANPGVGIANNYQDSTYNGSYSIITGNICTQVTGTHQAYGFADIGSGNISTSLTFDGNVFSGNGTADFLKAAGSILYSWVGKTYEYTDAWNPGAILTKASVSHSITAAGAAQGDLVTCSFENAANDGLIYSGYVYAANAATAVITNPTSGTVTPASGTVRVSIKKKAPF